MTFLLLKAIKSLLEEAFRDTVFRDPDPKTEAYASPKICIGALPPKRSGDEEGDFPFIVIRPAEGEDDDDGSNAAIRLICGAYTAEGVDGGFNDALNMVDRCRRVILQRRLLDNRFELVLPLKWHLGDKEDNAHPHPYYNGTLLATWRYTGAERLLSPEGSAVVFGSGYP